MLAIISKVQKDIQEPRLLKKGFVIIAANVTPKERYLDIKIEEQALILKEVGGELVQTIQNIVYSEPKDLLIPNEKVDEIFTKRGKDFLTTESFTKNYNKMIQEFLLNFVQTDLLEDGVHTVWGLLPEQWEIYDSTKNYFKANE